MSTKGKPPVRHAFEAMNPMALSEYVPRLHEGLGSRLSLEMNEWSVARIRCAKGVLTKSKFESSIKTLLEGDTAQNVMVAETYVLLAFAVALDMWACNSWHLLGTMWARHTFGNAFHMNSAALRDLFWEKTAKASCTCGDPMCKRTDVNACYQNVWHLYYRSKDMEEKFWGQLTTLVRPEPESDASSSSSSEDEEDEEEATLSTWAINAADWCMYVLFHALPWGFMTGFHRLARLQSQVTVSLEASWIDRQNDLQLRAASTMSDVWLCGEEWAPMIMFWHIMAEIRGWLLSNKGRVYTTADWWDVGVWTWGRTHGLNVHVRGLLFMFMGIAQGNIPEGGSVSGEEVDLRPYHTTHSKQFMNKSWRALKKLCAPKGKDGLLDVIIANSAQVAAQLYLTYHRGGILMTGKRAQSVHDRAKENGTKLTEAILPVYGFIKTVIFHDDLASLMKSIDGPLLMPKYTPVPGAPTACGCADDFHGIRMVLDAEVESATTTEQLETSESSEDQTDEDDAQ